MGYLVVTSEEWIQMASGATGRRDVFDKGDVRAVCL